MYELDDIQKEIVYSDADNIIAIAGAGSGKTTVLTERVKRILTITDRPEFVMVITFTNNATDELIERLQDVPNADKCFIGTIHALASKLLSNTNNNFTIYTEEIQNEYMEYLISQFAHHTTYSEYLNYIEHTKNFKLGKTDIEPTSILSKYAYEEIQILLGKGKDYFSLSLLDYPTTVETICRVNNVITFDELLTLCTEYHKSRNIDIDYLFVDEFQDVGYLEYEFIKSLNSKHNFFVGDDYQSIYGFKGGDVSIFLSLINNEEYTKYFMINNYRNAKMILNFANTIISKSSDIVKKSSVAMNPNMGNVSIKSKLTFDVWLREFSKVANKSEYFILTRNNSDLEAIKTKLNKLKIPFVSFKGSEVNREEQKRLLSTNAVKLLTIHASKGLESESVIMYGSFPISATAKTKSEEIKVFYVGITRAINNLTIFTGGK